MASDVFHAGERAVQERAGVAEQAAQLGPQMIQSSLPGDFAAFLASEPVIYLAVGTPSAVWVSALFGPPGFAAARSAQQIHVRARIDPDDPLSAALDAGPTAVGMLVLEPMTRGRIRLNGVAQRTADGLEIELREAFGNCPKYIQKRRPVALVKHDPERPEARRSERLDDSQRQLIGAADTFIVGSRHPSRGADASHRGGHPGFVSVSADGTALTYPDYPGNNMFQTLGNLAVDPRIGLLFVDWRTGRTLQLSGRAEVSWDDARLAAWPKARRLIDMRIEHVVDRPAGLPVVWEFVEASRVNPELPREGVQRADTSGADAGTSSSSDASASVTDAAGSVTG